MRGEHHGRLLDTVYFTHSHHSRFLQLADVLGLRPIHPAVMRPVWHEQEAFKTWEKLKASADTLIQHWP